MLIELLSWEIAKSGGEPNPLNWLELCLKMGIPVTKVIREAVICGIADGSVKFKEAAEAGISVEEVYKQGWHPMWDDMWSALSNHEREIIIQVAKGATTYQVPIEFIPEEWLGDHAIIVVDGYYLFGLPSLRAYILRHLSSPPSYRAL
jgi:hypothetical protein